MLDLRKLARGKDCQLRLHHYDGSPICNFDPSTVVLAHLRIGGIAGISKKPPDLCGVWACSSCHDVIDGRTGVWLPPEMLYKDILAGLLRTLSEVSKEMGFDR